ncbi:unnamed protein product [Somion occarium]|uniref:F-box domain-containing protein n=1 Tax=Somion occarium TaxID=3059160 RepID=A0ABP1CI82_9APHY
MHPALCIDEILLQVFSYLRPPNNRWNDRYYVGKIRSARKTLASMARTCKLFSEPALNLLWERQNSILPLLKVLPTFRRNENDAYSIVSPISPEDWERFQSYARRIHIFIYSSSKSIHSSVFACLAQARGDAPLLPSLRHIVWTRSSTFGDEMVLFVAPSLKIADIGPFGYVSCMDEVETFDGNHGLEVLLDSLVKVASNLEQLKVEGSLTSACTSSISRLRNLRVLDLSACGSWSSIQTFQTLATMEHLTQLQINTLSLGMDGGQTEVPFSSLQILEISGSPSSINSVVRSISSTHLRAITIKGTYSYPPEEWQPCCSTLNSRFSNSLREFRMNLLLGCLSMTKESEDVMQLIRPLVDISMLRVVALDLEGHLRVDDADITSMASAWRELREFRLWCHKSGNGPSLQSLAACAAFCPQLAQLELPIDARRLRATNHGHDGDKTGPQAGSPDSPCPSADVASFGLRRLTLLGNVGIDDPERVGSRIRGLFPMLRHFEAYAWDPSMNTMWTQVKRSLPSLRRTKPREPWVIRKPR